MGMVAYGEVSTMDQDGGSIGFKESIEAKTTQEIFVLKISDVSSDLEQERIRKRQTEGMASAKKRGKRPGRPTLRVPTNFENATEK